MQQPGSKFGECGFGTESHFSKQPKGAKVYSVIHWIVLCVVGIIGAILFSVATDHPPGTASSNSPSARAPTFRTAAPTPARVNLAPVAFPPHGTVHVSSPCVAPFEMRSDKTTAGFVTKVLPVLEA
jgi:hypothetical protein